MEESSNSEDSSGEEVSSSETASTQAEKVKALLSQQKILRAIESPDKLPDSLSQEQKDDMLEMAVGTIILNLSDNVLREVNDETTAFNIWKKLEGLYLTKSLTNKIYLKERLFSFKMDPSKGLGQNLDEFKKMTIELANASENEKLSDENEAIILLNSLPESFKDVKAAIKYDRSSLSLEECISALKSKDLELKIERKDGGENLFARGKSLVKNNNQNNKNKAACVASKICDKWSIWHKRLGHMSEKGLGELSKQNLLDGDQVNKIEFCENYILGKQHRLSFSTAQHTSKQTLEYIHSDLWGPAKVPTHRGNHYFLSLIDDFSRKVWIYLLKFKDQAFESFKTWKKLVENQTSRKIKTLRIDNGLEFCKDEFNKLCENEGIQRHRTDQEATHSDGMHQVEESQIQPEDNIDPLADYELVRDKEAESGFPLELARYDWVPLAESLFSLSNVLRVLGIHLEYLGSLL
ncbi:hypothetical protein EZV62_019243 [Acer yangbiense]|uniref:Integrase catalytic domain-containing protein n=1 Tax=Acer yangbiense TaxID=1000413 RepID=A0A5C7HAS4_9ROSI|nr:hypothetical protein EZV62_019243 [Acer yangbiense]